MLLLLLLLSLIRDYSSHNRNLNQDDGKYDALDIYRSALYFRAKQTGMIEAAAIALSGIDWALVATVVSLLLFTVSAVRLCQRGLAVFATIFAILYVAIQVFWIIQRIAHNSLSLLGAYYCYILLGEYQLLLSYHLNELSSALLEHILALILKITEVLFPLRHHV